jgi:hypothetical protein
MRISGLGGDKVTIERRSSYDMCETGLPNEDAVVEREVMSGLLGTE